jgi:ribosome recycling factor
MNFDKKKIEKDFEKTIEALNSNLNGVRAGRLVPEFISNVVVDDNGSKLKSVAKISNLDNFSLKVSFWDSSIKNSVASSLQNSGLGVGVNVEGSDVVVTAPKLTSDVRKELAKLVNNYGEEAKVSLRSKRRDSMENIKASEKSKEISEDISRSQQKEIEKIVEHYIKMIDDIINKKNKDILEI